MQADLSFDAFAVPQAPVIKSALQEAERRHLQQHAEEARADDAPAEAVEAHARDAAIRDDRRRGHAAPPEAVEADVADCDVRWQGRRASPQDPADSETEAGAACGFGDSGAMDVAGIAWEPVLVRSARGRQLGETSRRYACMHACMYS